MKRVQGFEGARGPVNVHELQRVTNKLFILKNYEILYTF